MGIRKIDLLKRLDEEEKKIGEDILESIEEKDGLIDFSIKDVLGIELERPLVTIPRVGCGVPSSSVWSLLPLYQSVILPISPRIAFDEKTAKKITTVKEFEHYYDMTPDEFAILAQKGRVIPYFSQYFEMYDKKLIEPFLEPGVPRITHDRLRLLNYLNHCKSFKPDCKRCEAFLNLAKKDLTTVFNKPDLAKSACSNCLSGLYMSGHRDQFLNLAHQLKDVDNLRSRICSGDWLTTSRNLDSILQTECPALLNIMTALSPLPESVSLEYIVKGLKVKYNPEIPLETYLDIMDGKTGKALRNIVKRIVKDPLACKYLDRLNAKIFEINREVEQLSKSKTSKIFSAMSDVVIYGGTEFIKQQSKKYINLPEHGLKKVGEWLSEKGMDLESKIVGRDWEIAQLFRARCKLEKCK